jgi:hypothetical protein
VTTSSTATRLPGNELAVLAQARVMVHEEAVRENWRVFHEYPPAGYHHYVYLYFDLSESLLYVGMTSNAVKRALTHWKSSDWWSWVAGVEYRLCRNRDAAYKLESKIRREEGPLFTRTGLDRHGRPGLYADIIRELDSELRNNHVLGICDCLDRETDSAYLASVAGSTVPGDLVPA